MESPGAYVDDCMGPAILAWFLCSFGLVSHALVVITCRGVGCHYMMQLG